MAWEKGFNCRNTSDYVADDGANCTYVLPESAYPTTRNGVTFGMLRWDGGAFLGEARNRNAGLVKLAGFVINYTPELFAYLGYLRVDLPAAGAYDIRLASGDPDSAYFHDGWIRIYDGTTLKATLGPLTRSDADHYHDAAGTEHTSAANWAANNAAIRVTFAGTELRVVLGKTTAEDETANSSTGSLLSHLYLTQVASAPTVTSLDVVSGTTAGGTAVDITGADFVATPGVTFGGEAATSVVRVSATHVTCVTPAHAAGAVDVVVTNPDTQSDTLTNGYTYTAAATAPTVTASAPTSVTTTTATGHGNVTDDGGATVTDRGVCWGTSANPTTSGSHAHAAAGGTGAFTADITGLSADTEYHYRTFAINGEGTSYSADGTFYTGVGVGSPAGGGRLIDGGLVS